MAHGNTKHGMHGTPVYRCWKKMRERCRPGYKESQYYFEKGIQVCERWDSFQNFYADMGDRPEGMSIERVDNSRGYSPDNCVWATSREQSINRDNAHLLTVNGETLCRSQWAERTGIDQYTIRHRIRAGWSHEDAVLTPVGETRGQS